MHNIIFIGKTLKTHADNNKLRLWSTKLPKLDYNEHCQHTLKLLCRCNLIRQKIDNDKM